MTFMFLKYMLIMPVFGTIIVINTNPIRRCHCAWFDMSILAKDERWR